MAASKQQAAGRHLTSCVLTLQTIAADGVLSDSTAWTLADRATHVGWIEEVDFESDVETDDGTVLGSPSANDLPGVGRNTVTLAFPVRYANDGNFLQKAYYNTIANADGTTGTPYAKVAIARGNKTLTFYGMMKTYREQFRKNKCSGTLILSMMDAGVANPGIA